MCTRRAEESGDAEACRADVGVSGEAARGLVAGRYSTPWGEGTVSVCRGRLAGVDLPAVPAAPGAGESDSRAGASPRGVATVGGEVDARDRGALARWIGQLEAYFRGEHLAWSAEDIALDELALSSFDRAVYAALLTVPPAVTVSYGVLAEMAGFPRAARAVGNTMATNPIPVVVPCHRVILSDGRLGNYGDDPAWKERLLEHEREHAGRRAAG